MFYTQITSAYADLVKLNMRLFKPCFRHFHQQCTSVDGIETFHLVHETTTAYFFLDNCFPTKCWKNTLSTVSWFDKHNRILCSLVHFLRRSFISTIKSLSKQLVNVLFRYIDGLFSSTFLLTGVYSLCNFDSGIDSLFSV